MRPAQNADERLRQIYDMLREVLEPPSSGGELGDSRWHAPPLPLNVDGRTSATDLLSWWFRPPSGEESAWNQYFGGSESSSTRTVAKPGEAPKTKTAVEAAERNTDPRAVLRALVDWPKDELANEDAECGIETFYNFLHAFGRRDVAAAMQHIAEDYHVFEDDREIDRHDLRSMLESLLESLHGFELGVSLSMIPEPLGHPYGIVTYAEIQIDARRLQDGVKRNLVERRLVLLQKQADFSWKISAFSKPRS
jgi:ketosteroid isomerase-like protein